MLSTTEIQAMIRAQELIAGIVAICERADDQPVQAPTLRRASSRMLRELNGLLHDVTDGHGESCTVTPISAPAPLESEFGQLSG